MKKCLISLFFFCFFTAPIFAADSLSRLALVYPHHIHEVTTNYIAWNDGTRMPIEANSYLVNHLTRWFYGLDSSAGIISRSHIQREHYEPIFKKMYGASAAEVKKNLVTLYWMSHVYGKRYPLKVTTINGVNHKLQRISNALEKLPLEYRKFLENPAGGFYWRKVVGESYLSTHSFGIAVDINSHYTNYWLWDILRLKKPISELTHANRIPQRIIDIFEKEGFFWGGHWYYYDTMHFEYRPDLLT